MLHQRHYRPHPMIDQETPMQERPDRTLCEVGCRLEMNGESVEATLVDFTDRGFQIVSDRWLPVGSTLMLSLPNCHPVEAVVRWALGQRAGCAFARPVRPEAIAAAVEAAQSEQVSGDGVPAPVAP